MKNLVMDYAKKNKEFDTALNELKKTYETEDVSDEVLADISGQLLGNQDFILNLSTKKPNIFKKMYDKIISIANKITGNSKEKWFIKDLKNKWEEAYRTQNNNLNKKQKFSIQQDSNGNKYVEVDTDQDIFNGIDEKDYNKIAKMYITDYLMGNTKLGNSDSVEINKKTSKKYTNPGKKQENFVEKMKLTPELKNVLEIATLRENSSANKINSKFANWEYYDFEFKLNGKTFKGNINVGITDKGKYLYEINNVKKTSGITGTSLHRPTGFSVNNIPHSNNNVNSNTSSTTKYSMQESKNDTQGLDNSSFSLDKNAKQYDVLTKTNYIKYFRKDNGDVKVYLRDSNNNTVNDLTLWSNTNAIKELGENLGNKIYETATNANQRIEIGNNINTLGTDTDYFMNHRPSEGYGNASNFEENMPDVFEHPEWYMNLNEKYNREALNSLKKVRNNPNAEMTIYRATIGNKINVGDWVSPSKAYAEYHNKSQFDGKANILEMKVKAKDIQFAGDDINEFGYFPSDSTKYSRETQTWQEHLEKNYKATGKRTNMADLRKKNIVSVKQDMKPYLEMGEIIKKENNPNYTPKIFIAEPELKKNIIAPPPVKKESKVEKFKTEITKAKRGFQYLVTNRNGAIDRFSDKVGNKKIKILADHVNNVQGEISTNINYAQIDNSGGRIGKSIVDIFEPARKEKLTDGFNDYLFNLSNIERHKQGKGSVIPLNESETLVKEYEKTYPQMKMWAKDVNEYNKNLLYEQVEADLISKETADYLTEKYPFYVPFIENIDTIRTNDIGKIITKSTVKKARGGSSKNLLTFEEAMIKQTQSAITNMRKNRLYNAIIDSLPASEKTTDFESNTDPNVLGNNLTTDKQNYLLSAYKDGKMRQAKIDKDLYEGLEDRFGKLLKELEQKFSLVTKPLQKISNVRRNILTTWSPTFIITNPLKDIQDAPLNSKYGASWIKNYPKAMKELTTGKGEYLEEFLNLYGQGNLWGGENVDSGVYDVLNTAKPKTKAPSNNKVVKLSKAMVEKITQLNEIMEMGPRYAEYLASLEHGTSQMEALYNAREVTTNFGRGGVITKALNRNGFTFLNASVQGFSKLIRNFSGKNGAKGVINASAKAVALGIAPALFNALWFDDDDDYNDLPDYIKDNYYLFKTDDNDFIRIPKGRMISIFGSAARRTLERAEGKRSEMTLKEDLKSYTDNAWSQVGIGDLSSNNILAPIEQAFETENGTAWYGGDIVPSRLQDKPAEDQYSGGIGDMILSVVIHY